MKLLYKHVPPNHFPIKHIQNTIYISTAVYVNTARCQSDVSRLFQVHNSMWEMWVNQLHKIYLHMCGCVAWLMLGPAGG